MKEVDINQDRKKQHGVVVNFLPRKGYGFIMGDDGQKVFVHYSDIHGREFKTLVDGEEVEYYLVQGPKGKQAVDVVRLNPPAPDEVQPLDSLKRTW